MTIKREINGVVTEITLTPDELVRAWDEQEFINDKAEINYLIEENDDPALSGIEWTDARVGECTQIVRKSLDRNDWLNENINEARQDAFLSYCGCVIEGGDLDDVIYF